MCLLAFTRLKKIISKKKVLVSSITLPHGICAKAADARWRNLGLGDEDHLQDLLSSVFIIASYAHLRSKGFSS
jgi:hypothetical protein